VWTSPIFSHNGFKYYVIFIDHFTKYIWFYPLKNKSDVKEVSFDSEPLSKNTLIPPLKLSTLTMVVSISL
jgi:hypothetical protein